jgi:hypothetical protein
MRQSEHFVWHFDLRQLINFTHRPKPLSSIDPSEINSATFRVPVIARISRTHAPAGYN